MIRSFVVLLLFVVVFLSGMLIGIDRENQEVIPDPQTESSPPEIATDHKELESIPREQVNYEQVSKIEGPEQTTQKMAFFLEAGVKGFYEMIVEVLYQISSLFI